MTLQRQGPSYRLDLSLKNDLQISEIIAINLVSELLIIDDERAWIGFCKEILSTCFHAALIELVLAKRVGHYIG